MTAPERFYGVSNTQLSVARYYGGAKVAGAIYTYDPATDQLVRSDVWRREQQAAKPKRKRRPKPSGEGLFEEQPNGESNG